MKVETKLEEALDSNTTTTVGTLHNQQQSAKTLSPPCCSEKDETQISRPSSRSPSITHKYLDSVDAEQFTGQCCRHSFSNSTQQIYQQSCSGCSQKQQQQQLATNLHNHISVAKQHQAQQSLPFLNSSLNTDSLHMYGNLQNSSILSEHPEQQQQQQQQPLKQKKIRLKMEDSEGSAEEQNENGRGRRMVNTTGPSSFLGEEDEEKDGGRMRRNSRIDFEADEIDLEETWYQEKAFFCLKRKSILRHWAIRLTLSPYFERITIFVILMNCVTLGLYDPYDEKCQTKRCVVLEGFEFFIYLYFLIEMLIKMIALGIFGKLGYLSEGWNRLDFFIVVAGTFELAYGDGEFLSSVRAVRVLRPLRAINRVPSIRILVTLLLDTLPMLGNVFILCILTLMVFAIIGVQLWQGILRNRCTLDIPANLSTYYPNISSNLESFYISLDEDYLICPTNNDKGEVTCGVNFGLSAYTNLTGCSAVYAASNISMMIDNMTSSSCVDWNSFYTLCKPVDENPNYGAISFDNSGQAFIAIFQAMTLEGWVDIMYYLQDGYSQWVWIYFVVLIVLGSYFLTNLCLVVVATQFSETRQRESALMEEARRKSKSTTSTIFTGTDSEHSGCYNQILSMIKHYIQRGCRKLKMRIFGEQRMKEKRQLELKKKRRRQLMRRRNKANNNNNNTSMEINKQNSYHPNGDIHHHHHHHHHIHHHHLHLCANGASKTVATTTPTTTAPQTTTAASEKRSVNGGVGYAKRCGSNGIRCSDCNINGGGPKQKQRPVSNPGIQTNALAVPQTTPISPPSIVIDDVDSCEQNATNRQPLPNLQMNSATALIIPDTTVVICHSSSGSLKSQSPMTTVSLFPTLSLSKLHRASMSEADLGSHSDMQCTCRYRSVDNPQCCFSEMSKDELGRYEKGVYERGRNSGDEEGYDSGEDYDIQETYTKKKRLLIVKFCESDCFKVSIMTAIFLNTVTMAMEHYQQPRSMTLSLEIFNTIFTTVFFIEFVLKFFGYGFYGYIKDAFNVFDGIVVIISLIELAGAGAGGVSVLRTFRLMRIFKLIRFLPTLQKQIQVMLETLDSVMTFLGLLTIFIFTASILGMHLFGGKLVFEDSDGAVRHNFDNLMWSLITVFQVLTQEDWNAVMYDAMRGTSKWASVYFVLLMIIGNYILFNLLVAILVEGFSSETEGILSSPGKSPLLKHLKMDMDSDDDQGEHENEAQEMDYLMCGGGNEKCQSMPNIFEDQYAMDHVDGCFEKTYHQLSSSESALNSRQVRFDKNIVEEYPIQDDCIGEDTFIIPDDKPKSRCIPKFLDSRKDWTLYIFSPKSKIRIATKNLVAHPWFDHVVLFFIFLNCVVMAMERPSIKPESTERQVIDISNHIFTVVFTIEMLTKIFADGFYFGEDTTYLKNGWNRIDFVLVIISLVDIFVTYVVQSKSGVLGVLKVFRAFRTLRPLRVISRAPGLKIVVETLINSLAPIGNLLIVGLVFFTIFGILGVQLFKGKFYHCSETEKEIITKDDCTNSGYEWINQKYNFDNLFQALFTLFVFSTKDGWVTMMYNGIDAVGTDMEPKKNANPWAFLYFVSFLLIAGFVVINMVVGVIIDNFQKCRVTVEGEEIEAGHQLSTSHPASDEDGVPKTLDEYSFFRRKVYDVVSHYKFDLVIAVIIGLNVIFMAAEHYQMPNDLIFFLRISNYVFTAIFILESALKIYGLGPRLFFSQRWNQLDIVIVLLSIVGIIFEELNSQLPINPTIIRIMRVLRIARVLKILKAADGIQKLLNCVTAAIPQVGNLSLLFMLIFFIYSALGIELFGALDCTLDTCHGISRHAHFRNFGIALLTLFRISTGDNWNGLLKDCINTKLCPEGCSMMPYMAPVYYCTFVLASQFVLVNVVVAVLMKQLEDAKENDVSSTQSIQEGLNADYDATNNDSNQDDIQLEGGRDHHDEDDLQITSSSEDRNRKYSNTSSIKSNEVFDNNENNSLLEHHRQQQPKYSNSRNIKNENNKGSSSAVDGGNSTDHIDNIDKSHMLKEQNHNDNSSSRCSDSEVPDESTTENNPPILRRNRDGENKNKEKPSEQEVNERVNNLAGLDYLDLDLEATMEALNGMRDSVISTCV